MSALDTLGEFEAMTGFEEIIADPRMAGAIEEIQQAVLARHPTTIFRVEPGEDPGSVWMWATVDVDDTDEVFDLVSDRLLDLQLERGIPLVFMPVWTPERIAANLRERHPQPWVGEKGNERS